MSAGTFSGLTTMYNQTYVASDSYVHSMIGTITVSHYGQDGFNVRVFVQEGIFTGPTNWVISEAKLTLCLWDSLTLNDQTGAGTILGDIVSSHAYFGAQRPPSISYVPPIIEQDNASGTTPHNSYYWYEYVNGAGFTCQDSTQYRFYVSCAAPMTAGPYSAYGFTPNIANRPLSETGLQLEYYGFEYQVSGNNLYLVNYSDHSYTQITATGYEVHAVFNRLDHNSHSILCWARRTSDSWYGVIEFTQALAFVQFVPVVATTGGNAAGYGMYALISNGFIFVGGASVCYCYYIDGAEYLTQHTVIIPEWN